jgi:hypothetical protein
MNLSIDHAGGAVFPSSPRRGGRDLNRTSRSLLYGADGVVIKFHKILLSLNTIITGCALSRLHSLRSSPSARARDASRRFPDRAATPPQRGGENTPSAAYSHEFCRRLTSQAFAKFQSRITVSGEIFRTLEVSSTLSPPKNRISTTWTFLASTLDREFKASSRASMSTPCARAPSNALSKEMCTMLPPRFAYRRLRAWSTRMRRIICAHTAKKCSRLWHSIPCERTSFRYASLTNAADSNVSSDARRAR